MTLYRIRKIILFSALAALCSAPSFQPSASAQDDWWDIWMPDDYYDRYERDRYDDRYDDDRYDRDDRYNRDRYHLSRNEVIRLSDIVRQDARLLSDTVERMRFSTSDQRKEMVDRFADVSREAVTFNDEVRRQDDPEDAREEYAKLVEEYTEMRETTNSLRGAGTQFGRANVRLAETMKTLNRHYTGEDEYYSDRGPNYRGSLTSLADETYRSTERLYRVAREERPAGYSSRDYNTAIDRINEFRNEAARFSNATRNLNSHGRDLDAHYNNLARDYERARDHQYVLNSDARRELARAGNLVNELSRAVRDYRDR